MDVGVRELKQHLSEYVDRAARGEIIRVTDRGRPRALLTPLADAGQLERGVAEGWVRAPTAALGPAQARPSQRKVLDVLTDDRGE
jgi:prevent-host-death family protein